MRTSGSEDQPSSGCKSHWCCLGGHSCVDPPECKWELGKMVSSVMGASSFPVQQLHRSRLGDDDGKGDVWRWVGEGGKEQGSSPQLLHGQSIYREGRYMSVLGAQVLRVCVKGGRMLEIMEISEGLKQKRQTDHKSGSSEGSVECFLSWCSCRSRSTPPEFAAPQEKMK